MTFAAAQIDPQDDDRNPVSSQNEPRSIYADQGLHQPYPGSQQRLIESPVSVTPDIIDLFSLYDNP